MTSTLEKYSQINSTRSFCPLILYHDKPSKQLSINLNVNKHNNRTAIDRHRDKTNEMLEHNALFWTNNYEKSGLVDDVEADYLDKDSIKVSPSTSTTSNISSSSSSSGESIATIDMHQYHQQGQYRSPVIIHQHHTYYNNNTIEEEEPTEDGQQQDEKMMYYPPLKMTNKPLSKPMDTTTTTTNTKKRRRGNLPKEVTEFLRKWLIQHKKHPYPAEKEKADLARHTGLTVNQISNWFINARRRILQPMLESENLTAQMMAYPDHLVNNAGPSSTFVEPPRRRRHDFYTYQRDFHSNIPDSASPPPMHPYHHQQQMHYDSPMEEDTNQRFLFRRTSRMMVIDDQYNNNQQIPMR